MGFSVSGAHTLYDRLWERRGLIAYSALALGLFAFGLTFEGMTLRTVMLMFFGLVALFVLSLPYASAIRLLFFYLGFEGMAKIITGYNPVVHVGGDALVVALSVRYFFSYLLQRVEIPKKLPPLAPLLLVHLAWFFIEFCNPYSIGIIPSIAGAKMYVTMVSLFVYGYYLSTSLEEVESYTRIWVITLAIQVVTSLYQGYVGPASVLMISGNYAEPLRKLSNYAFRPFGTTHLPGVPAVFIFLAAPLLVYHLIRTKSHVMRAIMIGLLPLMFVVLGLCQIRSALLKTIIGISVLIMAILAKASGEVRRKALLAVPVAAVLVIFVIPKLTGELVESRGENSAAFERTMSLFDYDRVSEARAGAADRIINYAIEVPLGAGLSRTGAAGGKFGKVIDKNPYYNFIFFTDNFWAATLAEIGVPGTIFITSIIFGVLILGAKNLLRTRDPRIAAMEGAILGALLSQVIGLWGAEGVLYNPEAPFFWFFAGALLRLRELDEEARRL